MNVGTLIRLLSHYCPDTNVSILTPDGELSIGALVSDEDEPDLLAELALTVMEATP